MSPVTSTLTRPQIAAAVRSAGFPENQVATAVAIALAESGGRASAVNQSNRNGSSDYGLFQINSVHKDLLARYDWRDPNQNAIMAYEIYKGAGYKWTPWAAFNSGSYRKFYSDSGLGDASAKIDVPIETPSVATPSTTYPVTASGFLGYAGTTAFWQRVGIGLLGTALIIAGVIIVFRRPLAKTASVVTSVASKGLVNVPTE